MSSSNESIWDKNNASCAIFLIIIFTACLPLEVDYLYTCMYIKGEGGIDNAMNMKCGTKFAFPVIKALQ